MHNAHSSAFDATFRVLSVGAVQLRGEEHVMNIWCSILVVFLLLLHGRGSRPAEVSCLNSMSLSELLRLKHSVELLSCSSEDRPPTAAEADNRTGAAATTGVSLSDGSPSALPLTHARSYPEPWTEKPTKLHTLFQVSVTALAFLSFGGYLLCLIVQAIKSKGTTYFHPVATATSTTNSGQVKKIKIFRRSRRMANSTLRTEEASYVDSMAGPDPEELYKTLLYFAEGYVVGLK